jgi:predicted ArsR family transcriptional regulator
MEVSATEPDDVLALPARAQLFHALSALRRPASTRELAGRVGRHRNTVRLHLLRMADAGLLEHRVRRHGRGRPRDEWVISAAARPGGMPPRGHAELARWLARAIRTEGEPDAIEAVGREIGHELAAEAAAHPAEVALADALAALGFAPRVQREPTGRTRFVLGNCPYREAVLENAPAVCGLHRGITRGMLDRLAPAAELDEFVVRHPERGGCAIGIAGLAPG